MADYFVGVDLGKLTDPTALTVMARSLAISGIDWPAREVIPR